jgi:hypothetical protein
MCFSLQENRFFVREGNGQNGGDWRAGKTKGRNGNMYLSIWEGASFIFEFAVWSLNLHPCSRGKGDGLSFNWVKSNALIGHVAFYYLCQTDNNFLARFKFSGLYIYSFQVFYYFGVRIYLFEYCRSIWKFYYFKNLVLINILLTWMFFL